MTTSPDPQPIAERQLCGLVNGLAQRITDHVRVRAATLGLTAAQATALREMSGPMTMRELAERMTCEPSNTTFVVDKLEKQGLVERHPHPTDRRAKHLVLTAEGAALRTRLLELLVVDSPCPGSPSRRSGSCTNCWSRPSPCREPVSGGRAPAVQHRVDPGRQTGAGCEPGDTGHQQRVVLGVGVPHGGPYRHRHRLLVQGPARGGAADPAAAAHGGVGGDRPRPLRRTSGEQPQDLGGERRREPDVLGRAARPVALPAAGPGLGVREAGAFGAGQGRVLDQQALAFVTTSAPVPAHDDGGERTGLPGAAGERGIAPRQVHQVPQIGTVQAAGHTGLAHQTAQRTPTAFGAVDLLQ